MSNTGHTRGHLVVVLLLDRLPLLCLMIEGHHYLVQRQLLVVDGLLLLDYLLYELLDVLSLGGLQLRELRLGGLWL